MTQAMVCDSLAKAGAYGAAARLALGLPAVATYSGIGKYSPVGLTTDYSRTFRNAGSTAWGYIYDATIAGLGLSIPVGASVQTIDTSWVLEPLGYSRAVVCDGNSLTAGTGSSPGGYADYPTVTAAALNVGRGPYYLLNNGVGGIGTPAMTVNAPSVVDPVYATWRNKNILVAWECSNDIAVNGASGATAYANFVTYCTTRRAVGWKVVAVNVLPRPPGGAPFVTARGIVNASIAANWGTFADAFVDLTADVRLQDATNALYYNVDQVHLTDAGYGIVGALMFDKVALL